MRARARASVYVCVCVCVCVCVRARARARGRVLPSCHGGIPQNIFNVTIAFSDILVSGANDISLS